MPPEAAAAANARRLPAPLLIQVGTSGQVEGCVEMNIRRSPEQRETSQITINATLSNHPVQSAADGRGGQPRGEREGEEWEGTAGAGELPIQTAGPVHGFI